MDGRAVGFVANQPMKLGGMLTAPACEKIAHFVAVCDAYGMALIYLIDAPGFSIGTSAEKSMLGRRSARMVYEIGHATVPRMSLVLRKGYGMGYVPCAAAAASTTTRPPVGFGVEDSSSLRTLAVG